jgi:hydrogenase expression/formation protein HypE
VDFSGLNACEGDKILLSGAIGDHGITILSTRKGIEFETSVKSDCAPLDLLVNDLLPHAHFTHAMRDLTRDGLATILNEIAIQSDLGITVYENMLVGEDLPRIC